MHQYFIGININIHSKTLLSTRGGEKTNSTMRYKQWHQIALLEILCLLQLNFSRALLLQPITKTAKWHQDISHPRLFHTALGDDSGKDIKNNDTDSSINSIVKLRGGDTNASPMDSLKKLYKSYLRAIEERPLLTKGLTAAVVNFLGDILAQNLEAKAMGIKFFPNWVRLQGFSLCGLLYIGPYVHTWYEQLWKIGRWMEATFGSPKRIQTLVQLLVDQTIGVAIFFSTYFYVYELIDAFVSHRRKCQSFPALLLRDNCRRRFT